LGCGGAPSGRVRRAGGGRKRADVLDPGLRSVLLALVEPDVRGDAMSPLRWTTKSTRKLAEELTGQGHRVLADTVGDLLREEGFSLQANAKTLEGTQHPDRDAQFRYLNEQARAHRDTRQPVVSVVSLDAGSVVSVAAESPLVSVTSEPPEVPVAPLGALVSLAATVISGACWALEADRSKAMKVAAQQGYGEPERQQQPGPSPEAWKDSLQLPPVTVVGLNSDWNQVTVIQRCISGCWYLHQNRCLPGPGAANVTRT
jgi:Rhodopirellula transposase DDE domain